jgi:hypothetical protein
MITIHDLQAIGARQKHYWCIEPSCPFYEFAGSKETLPTQAWLYMCKTCRMTEEVASNQFWYDVLRLWTKRGKRQSDLLELPSFVRDKLNAMMVEVELPPGACDGIFGSGELPADCLNQRGKPKLKHFIGHLWEQALGYVKRRIHFLETNVLTHRTEGAESSNEGTDKV